MLSYTIVLTDKANNTITIPASDIVQDSLQYARQYLNGLESSSQFVRVSIVGDSSSAAWILTHKNVGAVLTCNDEDDPYHYNFAGLLSEKTSWSIGSNGCRNLQVTIEDKRSLLDLAYDESKDVYYSGTLDSLVEAIAEKTSLTFGSDYSEMGSTPISSMISRGTTCKEVLTTACYECCTFFTVDGNFINLHSIQGADEDESILTENDIWDKNGSAISVNKDLQQYYEAEVRYKVTKSLSDTTIFRDDSFNAQKPHSLAAHYYYPGDKPITSTDPGTPSQAGAAFVETGKKLVTFSNPVIHVTASPSVTSTCTKFDDGSVNILLKNNNSVSSIVSNLSVTADIVYEDVEERINVGVESNKKYAYEAQWIHNKTAATHLVNLIHQYYQYCDYDYTFYTKNILELGKVYTLDESLFSGIDTEILITKVEYTSKLMDGAPLFKVSAIGWSEFNLDLPGRSESSRIIPPESGQGIPGEEGPAGEDAKVFEIVCPTLNFNSDKRSTGTVTVNLSADVQGYDSVTPTWTTTVGTISPSTGLSTTLTFLKSTASDVTVTMTATGITPAVFTIHPIDTTIYDKDFGYLANPSSITETKIVGDYFVASETSTNYIKGNTYEYQGASIWPLMDAENPANVSKFLEALDMLKLEGVDLSTLNNPNTVSWFNLIIADKAIIAKLFSERLTMTGAGLITSDPYAESDGTGDLPVGTPTQGYRLTATDGKIKSYGSIFNQMTAYNANLNGSLTHPFFKTSSSSGSTVTISFPNPVNQYYSASQFLYQAWNITYSALQGGSAYNCLNRAGVRELYWFGSSRVAQPGGGYTNGTITALGSSNFPGTRGVYYIEDGVQRYEGQQAWGAVILYNECWKLGQSSISHYCYSKSSQDSYVDISRGVSTPTSLGIVDSNNLATFFKTDDVWSNFSEILGLGEKQCNSGSISFGNSFTSFITDSRFTTPTSYTTLTASASNPLYITATAEMITIKQGTNTYTIQKGDYIYGAFNASSLVVEAGFNGIETENILPMSNSGTIGSTQKPFDEIHSNDIYGNINSQGTSNIVYGAVFN